MATPLQQQVQFTGVASEAGSGGSRRSEADGLQGRLDAANASIAQLSLQLGEARAQLAAAAELREMSVKFAVLEAKLAAQDEIKELEATVASMRLEWAQWGAPREAELFKAEAELLMGAPGLAEPTAPTASQEASVPAAQTGIPGAQCTAAQTGIPGAQCTTIRQTTRRDWRRARKTSLATFLSSGQCASGCCGRVPTTDTLDTLDRRLPTTDTPDLRPSGATMLSAFTEKPKQSLRPLHSNSGDEWEVIDAILDSGASVTVIPPHMAAGHPVQESAASRAGVQYEVANGEEIPNLGEKLFAVVTEEGSVRGMRPQVADVSKALQSVRALVKTGHLVVFGDGADGNEHYILNRESGEVNAVRDDGLNYLMRLYVIPPGAQQPFAGQAEAR